MTGRSAEAKRRRGPARARAIANQGRRIACPVCKLLHEPPTCPPGAESVSVSVHLPPHVARALNREVNHGERSPWIVRLIRKELGV